MPTALGPQFPLTSILPFLLQILRFYSGPLLPHLLCQDHVCLFLPSPLFHKSKFNPSFQAEPPAVSRMPLSSTRTHRTSRPLTISPPPGFHQKDEETAATKSPAYPVTYWLSHLRKITPPLRASVFLSVKWAHQLVLKDSMK